MAPLYALSTKYLSCKEFIGPLIPPPGCCLDISSWKHCAGNPLAPSSTFLDDKTMYVTDLNIACMTLEKTSFFYRSTDTSNSLASSELCFMLLTLFSKAAHT